MNQNEIMVCHKCFDRINNVSVESAQVWLKIVEKAHVASVFCYTENALYDNQFRLLENMGFLVSTDVSDHIEFKIMGKKRDLNGNIYLVCGDKCHAG